MKIYIVLADPEDREVKAVFSTQTKAEEFVVEYDKFADDLSYKASWKEWEVDGYYMEVKK